MAKHNPDETQQFNSTLLIAIVVAAVLAFCVVAVIYGCAKSNGAPKTNTPTTGAAVLKI